MDCPIEPSLVFPRLHLSNFRVGHNAVRDLIWCVDFDLVTSVSESARQMGIWQNLAELAEQWHRWRKTQLIRVNATQVPDQMPHPAAVEERACLPNLTATHVTYNNES